MVTINGEAQAKDGLLLLDFLQEAGYDSRAVAVEYNGEILAKEDYAATRLKDGDVAEVVCFMGGGC
ncbi:MAG: Sulfur carrier protein ThiS [Mitsuokella multacida]